MEDYLQWAFIVFLLLVCLRHALIIDRGAAPEPSSKTDVTDQALGPAFDVTFNLGRKRRETQRIHAINEGDVVRVLLARGLDINQVVSIVEVKP